MRSRTSAVAGLIGQLALPVLVALVLAPLVKGGGTLLPWSPALVDLDVYQYTGHVVLDAGTSSPHAYLQPIQPIAWRSSIRRSPPWCAYRW